MCFSELLRELQRHGLTASESQIRWAIKSGRVSRPRVDGSLRFDFRDENVAELVAYFCDKSRHRITVTGLSATPDVRTLPC